jgi:hypothetical protein
VHIGAQVHIEWKDRERGGEAIFTVSVDDRGDRENSNKTTAKKLWPPPIYSLAGADCLPCNIDLKGKSARFFL